MTRALSMEEEALHREAHLYPRHLEMGLECLPCRFLATLDAERARLSEPAPLDVREPAQRLVDVIFEMAEEEAFVLPMRGMRAASDLRAALQAEPKP